MGPPPAPKGLPTAGPLVAEERCGPEGVEILGGPGGGPVGGGTGGEREEEGVEEEEEEGEEEEGGSGLEECGSGVEGAPETVADRPTVPEGLTIPPLEESEE